MSEEQLISEAKLLSPWQRYGFIGMVAVVIAVAVGMVSVSMYLYFASGAAQLDLSRPGYRSVQKQIDKSKEDEHFSSMGALNRTAIDSFRKQYDAKLNSVQKIDPFGGDVLSDESLSLTLLEIDE